MLACACAFEPISQGHKRVAEPVIGHFKLLASMKVRATLKTITHTGVLPGCMMPQYTGLVSTDRGDSCQRACGTGGLLFFSYDGENKKQTNE